MIWAACCLGFLRSSAFTVPAQDCFGNSIHLSPQDIAIDCQHLPGMIKVSIKQSKTNPFRHGVNLYLGKTDKDICPVKGIFAISGYPRQSTRPLFMGNNEKMLTRQIFSTELDCILSKLKLDKGSYNMHSFRIGAATSAMEAGIPETQIKMLGRWQCNAYQGYVKTPPEDLAKLSKLLASKCKPCRNKMWSQPILYSLGLIITLCTSLAWHTVPCNQAI